jgi:multidrug efflux pump subunit AcrA (membrane-fusion protein)
MAQAPPKSEASEEVLWRLFGSTNTAEAFCSAWLGLQCLRVRGVSAGIVLLGAPDQDRQFLPAACWPDNRVNLEHLASVAERAVNERRGLLLKKATSPGYEVAYPVQVMGRLLGVVALDVEPRPEAELREVMYQLQWGSAWMEVLFHRGQTALDQAPQQRLQTVVDMLATMAAHDGFHGVSVALATAMATHFACDRVSVGFIGRGGLRVEAISHSTQLAKDANLMRAIAAAMEEATDQHASVVFPPLAGRESLVTREHAELARQFGNGAICTFALSEHGQVVGALTMERPEDFPFDQQTVDVCESLAALAGPMLELHRRDDRWLWRKALDSVAGAIGKLIGPRRLGLKLGFGTAVAVIAFLTFADGVFRVTADTVIEPARRQALVASFAGYVRTAPIRAGDVVSEGEVLATLDDRDLRLERGRWQSQEEQGKRQYYEALGSGRAPEIQIFSAQIDQSRAQVALLDAQIGRTSITAPFAGVVVNGDLSQALGSPVERGQVLFELAPLDAYRVVIQVDERDIAQVTAGQHGELVLAGFADQPLPFAVKRLTPVSVTAEGRNFFRVEAELQNAAQELRPGMEGVAKIEVGDRRLVWIWTHELIDWARLKLWTLLP